MIQPEPPPLPPALPGNPQQFDRYRRRGFFERTYGPNDTAARIGISLCALYLSRHRFVVIAAIVFVGAFAGVDDGFHKSPYDMDGTYLMPHK